MIRALAEAGAVLERDDYLDAARRAAAFVLDEMRSPEGHLLRTYNAGEAKLNAYLEDHAFMLEALLTLYEATFESRWFGAAQELADAIIERFGDPERGGFFQTSSDHERLVARRKEIDDAPIPSGQSSAAFGLLRLAALTGEARYEEAALGVLRLFGDLLRRSPLAFGHLLQALDFHLATVHEVALVGSDTSAMQRVVRAVVPAQRRPRGRRRQRRRRRPAAGRPLGSRRRGDGLRLRALCVRGAGHRTRGARGTSPIGNVSVIPMR